MYYSDDEVERDEFYDYGLSFDYVAPDTFSDVMFADHSTSLQKQGFFRYQLSWGGPSDEFRIYTNPDFTPHCIEYVYQDWFDGAALVCNEIDHPVVWDICTGIFTDCGYFESSFNKSKGQNDN